MNNTPITDKAWDEIPHYVMSFGRAIRMRDACREMEHQRNELLQALEQSLEEYNACGAISNETWENADLAIAKAKGATP